MDPGEPVDGKGCGLAPPPLPSARADSYFILSLMPTFNDYKQAFVKYFQRHKRLPSYAEMMDIFGFKSKNAVAKVVQKLIDEELVRKDECNRLIALPKLFGAHMLGSVQAGFPTHAEEEQGEAISLDEYLISKHEQTYLLEVNGDSMVEAGINEGDLVIVEQGGTPRENDIVVAEVDGDWTLKYYVKEKGKIILRPANKNYRDIVPQSELKIGGVVTGVVRKYK